MEESDSQFAFNTDWRANNSIVVARIARHADPAVTTKHYSEITSHIIIE